jgi:hypothetical protein
MGSYASYHPPSSPMMPMSDDEDAHDRDEDMDRDTTPVRAVPTMQSTLSTVSEDSSTSHQPLGGPFNPPTSPKLLLSPPRIRKRRSSSSLAASPLLNAIKSPSRHAGTALHLQRRVRSGSAVTQAPTNVGNAATEGNSLMGRIRSHTVAAGASGPPNAPVQYTGTQAESNDASTTRRYVILLHTPINI